MYTRYALALYTAGKRDEAFGILEKRVEAGRQSTNMSFVLINMYLETGATAKAEQEVARLLTFAPDYGDAYNIIGTIQHNKGNYKQAIEGFSKAIELNENLHHVYRNRALAYIVEKQYSEALADLEHILIVAPNDIRTKALYGHVLVKTANYKAALPYLKDASEYYANSPEVGLDYAQGLVQTAKYAAAINEAERVKVVTNGLPNAAVYEKQLSGIIAEANAKIATIDSAKQTADTVRAEERAKAKAAREAREAERRKIIEELQAEKKAAEENKPN